MIFISACETSGDLHAAHFVKVLQETYGPQNMKGIGGKHLKKQGVDLLTDITLLSSVGILESIKTFPLVWWKLRASIRFLKTQPITLIILVDAQGINLRLLQLAHKRGIPSLYYFPPQVSLWGSWNTKRVARACTFIITPFKKDAELYAQAGGKVLQCRHPALDSLSKHEHTLTRKHSIGLFPGSRKHEIKTLLPIMLQALTRLFRDSQEAYRNYEVRIFVAHEGFLPLIQRIYLDYPDINIEMKKQGEYQHYAECSIAIAASGTVTLELSFLEIPTLVLYKTSWLTYRIAKTFVHSTWASLPNILSRKEIIEELIQKDCTADTLYHKIRTILTQPHQLLSIQRAMRMLSQSLEGAPHLKECMTDLEALIHTQSTT